MKTQTAQFCSTCHKVHLDIPVNYYRWVRGFNEYDNWQASGVSGAGRAFFLLSAAAAAMRRLPHAADALLTIWETRGNVHSHSFPGRIQRCLMQIKTQHSLRFTENFLKSGAVTVDIFRCGARSSNDVERSAAATDLSTTFAVGEEAENKITAGRGKFEAAAPVTAPLNRMSATRAARR